MPMIFTGWCSSVFSPCWSPTMTWIGATRVAIHIAMENITQEMKGADRTDHECRGEIGREHHMHEAVGKGRVEDHLQPARRDKLAGVVHRMACRRLHPGIGREDPEGG